MKKLFIALTILPLLAATRVPSNQGSGGPAQPIPPLVAPNYKESVNSPPEERGDLEPVSGENSTGAGATEPGEPTAAEPAPAGTENSAAQARSFPLAWFLWLAVALGFAGAAYRWFKSSGGR